MDTQLRFCTLPFHVYTHASHIAIPVGLRISLPDGLCHHLAEYFTVTYSFMFPEGQSNFCLRFPRLSWVQKISAAVFSFPYLKNIVEI